MIKIHSISHLSYNKKAKPNIPNPEPLLKKKEQAVSAKKLNASKCTANASPQENTALLNAHATVATITSKVKP
jgi:hypothetical protein